MGVCNWRRGALYINMDGTFDAELSSPRSVLRSEPIDFADRRARLSTRFQKFAHVFRSRKGNTLADFPRVISHNAVYRELTMASAHHKPTGR